MIEEAEEESEDDSEFTAEEGDLLLGSTRLSAPCVFKWDQGGRQVMLMGSFTKEPLEMVLDGKEFSLVLELRVGSVYEFKYVVDGRMQIDPQVESRVNSQGVLINILDLVVFDPFTCSSSPILDEAWQDLDFGVDMPIEMDNTKDPPKKPAYFEFMPINSPCVKDYCYKDPPLPTLNHLYVVKNKVRNYECDYASNFTYTLQH